MIQNLTLKNFQSHKKSELEFSPGVNVIVGESDSGKTAILRSLYWLIFGKPSGTSFIRHGIQAPCVVSVEMGERFLSRERGDGTNLYRLDDEVYKGFGQNVPEPVSTFVNMNKINFMRQMDPPFLFSKTAGEVAQYLNRLINLDVIDTSLSNIKSQTAQMKRSAENAELNIARIEEELKTYDWIDGAEKAVKELDRKEQRIYKLQNAEEKLGGILKRYNAAEENVQGFQYGKFLLKEIQNLETRHRGLVDKKQRAETVRVAISRVAAANMAASKAPNTKGLDRAILALELRHKNLAGRMGQYNALREVIIAARNCNEKLRETIAAQKQAALQYKQAMPKICPLCEQPIK